MSRGDTDTTFVCPECRSEVPVTPPMRTALLDEGCVVCGAAVSADAFGTVATGRHESAPEARHPTHPE